MEAWDRQPKEPAKWYARFKFFCEHYEKGLDKAYQSYMAMTKGKPIAERAPGSWRDAYRTWRWDSRASDYDDHQKNELARKASEEEREKSRLIHRSWKVQVQTALEILSRAKLNSLDVRDARRLVPTATRLLQNCLVGLVKLPADPEFTKPEDRVIKIVLRKTDGTEVPMGPPKKP